MDRFALELPSKAPTPATDSTLELLAKKGDEHERNYLNLLKAKHSDLVEIARDANFNTSYENTISAMKQGVSVIFQGALKYNEFQGYTDFLVKKDGASLLGDYHYEVWDTKLSRHVKPEYSLQLCAYSEMLYSIQGLWPKNFSVVLGNGVREELPTEDFKYYFLRTKNRFLVFQKSFDVYAPPTPQSYEDFGKWEEQAENILRQKDHLSFVAGISISQIKKLENSGTPTLTILATSSTCPPDFRPDIFDKLKKQAQLQLTTKSEGKTQFQVIHYRPEEAFGLARLPPSHVADVFFDMEGYPLVDGGLEYLFGATYLEGTKPKFIDWWALDTNQEKAAFEGWIDWVIQRWKQNPGMHIYHYAAYEVTAMKKLMGKHMTREHEVDQLLRHGVFIDLYRVVREGLVVGEESYSIKKLEGLYNFNRTGDVKKASDSVVQFAVWMQTPDGNKWQHSVILKEIRDYNEEDCVSTLELFKWLQEVKKQNKIPYVPAESTADAEDVHLPIPPSEVLATQLMGNLPTCTEKASIQKVLAGLIGYHRREAKPQWWSFFERLNSLPEDLTSDLECLAECIVAKLDSKEIQVKFDRQQETKLKEGDQVVAHSNDKLRLTIDSINLDTGYAVLSGKPESLHVGDRITLIPTGPIPTKSMEDSILAIAKKWQSSPDFASLRPCLKTFLKREFPSIQSHKAGDDLDFDSDAVSTIFPYAENLNSSVLAIQGPPGTGKTYTASHLVAYLLSKGKRIGITSNSHKAIDHLMEKSYEVLAEKGQNKNYAIYKIGATPEDEQKLKMGFLYSKNTTEFWKKPKSYNLVGGTSWFFAAENSKDRFDYLFIEEAGQFSLANCVACAGSTNNLVLLGDQMQLEQPIQGTHPEDIAESALGYYLKGHATIPANMGIFLGVSRRMNPNVCQFISDSVYDSRLTSHENTVFNLVKNTPHPFKESGIIFVPVAHEGNSQGSIEEVAAISGIIQSLKDTEIHAHGRSEEKFGLHSCLFISPFNMQVGLLKNSLGDKAKVGSVDLFQGQEAPVVFISMCSSNGDISPRGLEFLLSKNRLNVAISRAKSLAIIVGSSALADSRANSIEKARLLNLFCKILVSGELK